MSNREKAISLIYQIPDHKLKYIVDMLTSINNLLVDETPPDEWDLAMIAEAKRENDGPAISFEELLKKEGLTYADLQDPD